MKRFISLAALGIVLAAHGWDASAVDANGNAQNEPTDSEVTKGWFFEIDALDVGRVEGNKLVFAGNQIEAVDTLRRGSFRIIIVPDPISGPGTYKGVSRSGFVDRKEPRHRCSARELTVEVASVEPLNLTFSGDVECWAGRKLRPDDADNPGSKIPATPGRVSGGVSWE